MYRMSPSVLENILQSMVIFWIEQEKKFNIHNWITGSIMEEGLDGVYWLMNNGLFIMTSE